MSGIQVMKQSNGFRTSVNYRNGHVVIENRFENIGDALKETERFKLGLPRWV